jgi:hypothetical protein
MLWGIGALLSHLTAVLWGAVWFSLSLGVSYTCFCRCCDQDVQEWGCTGLAHVPTRLCAALFFLSAWRLQAF